MEPHIKRVADAKMRFKLRREPVFGPEPDRLPLAILPAPRFHDYAVVVIEFVVTVRVVLPMVRVVPVLVAVVVPLIVVSVFAPLSVPTGDSSQPTGERESAGDGARANFGDVLQDLFPPMLDPSMTNFSAASMQSLLPSSLPLDLTADRLPPPECRLRQGYT